LPKYHDYGDKKSVLKDNTIILGKEQHDSYIGPEMRIRCRKRCTIVKALAQQTGLKRLDAPLPVTLCLSAIPDWQATGLDAEAFFLRPSDIFNGPKIGPYSFNIGNYISSTYEDLIMYFEALKSTIKKGQKFHLKIIPLGIGPTVRTRFNDYLGPFVIPAYLLALQYACNEALDSSWIDVIEFVDHTQGTLCPYVSINNVRIISRSTRDAFDFTDCRSSPAIIAPCDAFCSVGSKIESKNLVTTLSNNSNLRLCMDLPLAFKEWPFYETK
jgi:hypothetical protein